MLCKTQIYRHIFFNKEKIDNIKRSCLSLTLIVLTMLYWYENRVTNLHIIQDYVSTQFVPGLSAIEQKMHKLQSQNLAFLYYFDSYVLLHVLSEYFTFLLTIFGLSLIFKMLQTQKQVSFDLSIISEANASYRLFWRLWLTLAVSQAVYLGVFIVIIWNYNPVFFKIVRFYGHYSAFTCVRGIVNSQYEVYIALFIVALANWVGLMTNWLVFSKLK